jgi:hypothetical protein
VVIAKNTSGEEVLTNFIGATDAVLLFMDPNAITHLPQRSTLHDEIQHRTKWFRSISVLGCNNNGMQGVISRKNRGQWFEWMDQQVRGLSCYPKQDLLLVRYEGDAAKWGYVIRTAVKWKSRTATRVTREFAKVGRIADMAWQRDEPGRFHEIQRKLFLMAKEMG